MLDFLRPFFEPGPERIKIFEGMDNPMPNFNILATQVRAVKNPKNYILDDGNKLKSIVEKWQFRPGGPLSRCGYDYQIVFTNGDSSLPISICFLCNTLVFNNIQMFRVSKRKILSLLKEDFRPL